MIECLVCWAVLGLVCLASRQRRYKHLGLGTYRGETRYESLFTQIASQNIYMMIETMGGQVYHFGREWVDDC